MSKKAVVLTIIIFTVIVGGMFGFAYLKKQEVVMDQQIQEEDPQPEVRYADISRIEAKHYFIDGVHTLVGEVAMPTPCDLLNHDVMVAESYPEQVSIDFTVINNSVACAQVITPARFKVEFSASKEATISASLEGRRIELNLIPAEPGEHPDDYELFIKG